MNPLFLTDFYKVDHISQYPSGTQQIWLNWTPRSSRVPDTDGVVFFGLQWFIKEILRGEWERNFFQQPLSHVLDEYKQVIKATLGIENPKTDHIADLHAMGYLPIRIYALPEGTLTPIGVPMLVLTNTSDRAFWLPGFLETILSASLWKPCTSATTARRFRKLFEKYARQFGEKDLSFVDYQGHDFSERGMSGRDDFCLSGMGHLLSFTGTDTIPAILAAHKYYGAPYNVGGSVPATEHSVMCAGTQDGEFETFERLITKTYPTGVVSIVSDTWDLWKVLTEYVPRLREVILKREGKVVIRPDSGDPVKIMVGDPEAPAGSPANEGALTLLARAMGTDGSGHINKAGLIYGDGISLERADAILKGCVVDKGLSPFNVVFGIGSWTYEHTTRDQYNFAVKATATRRNGKLLNIFKKPVTDNFHKASLCGIPVVYRDNQGLYVIDGRLPSDLEHCSFRRVYENGRLLIEDNFEAIRERARL